MDLLNKKLSRHTLVETHVVVTVNITDVFLFHNSLYLYQDMVTYMLAIFQVFIYLSIVLPLSSCRGLGGCLSVSLWTKTGYILNKPD